VSKDMMRKEIGSLFKSKRKALGLTQLIVAKRLGYGSSQFISNFERAIALPPVKDLKKICRILKIDKRVMADLWLAHSEAIFLRQMGL